MHLTRTSGKSLALTPIPGLSLGANIIVNMLVLVSTTSTMSILLNCVNASDTSSSVS